MEDGEILKMVEYALRHLCFIIDVIVSNNDSTMQDVPKHPSIGAQGQVMNSSKVKLDEEIPVPSFLAYPSYRVEVVANNICSIVNDGKARQCGCTKSDTIILKKDWGYMIKNNRNRSLEELLQASKVPLEHMFKNHGKCSAEWCFNTRAL